MVRIWDRIAGEDRWQEKYRFDHGSPIRSLACTGPKATKNYLVTATFAGHLRLFDLDNIKTPAVVLGKDDEKARHQGAVHAVAFNAKGTLCASGGDDRSICIWDVEKGTLLAKKSGAHKSMITSLSFTPSGTLVSAGRDRRLAVWEIKDSELIEVDELPGRSNDVGVLGLDPTGEKVLFDEGRELRVISLGSTTRHRIEGSLLNAGATGTFSTMALFSPNGRTIMTNGNGPGRLQLWRAPTVTNRAAELRQLLWISGTATCGAFDPSGNFAVTGTSDHRILVWDLPKKEESEKPLPAQLTYVEDFLDTGLKKLNVRATLLEAKDWVIPGSSASLVVPAR
jgi:WD40 repeat protein